MRPPRGLLSAGVWSRLTGVSIVCALALVDGACSRTTAPPGGRVSGAGGATVVTAPLPVHRYEPPDLGAGEKVPLLLYLHGYANSGEQSMTEMGLLPLGQQQRIFVVAPDGAVDRAGKRFWNTPSCCNRDGILVDDVARITAVLDEALKNPHVDPKRVFLMGYSNGAFMANVLACHIGARFAAMASISGVGPASDQPCPITAPLAVLQVHGDADADVPYRGGNVWGDRRLATFISAPATTQAWAARVGCTEPGPVAPLAPPIEGMAIKVSPYLGCKAGAAVELWTVEGGNHHIANPTTVARAWQFLAEHGAEGALPPPRATPND